MNPLKASALGLSSYQRYQHRGRARWCDSPVATGNAPTTELAELVDWRLYTRNARGSLAGVPARRDATGAQRVWARAIPIIPFPYLCCVAWERMAAYCTASSSNSLRLDYRSMTKGQLHFCPRDKLAQSSCNCNRHKQALRLRLARFDPRANVYRHVTWIRTRRVASCSRVWYRNVHSRPH